MKNELLFKCNYCPKKFSNEKNFLRHKCKLMLRDENFRTIIGQAAWQYYQEWFRIQRKRVPDDRAFIRSNFYESFNKFAKFVKATNLPNPHIFIKLMVSHNYPPTMWTSNEVYVLYLEHLDRHSTPQEHAEITVNTLDKLADAAECDIEDIFDHLTANDIIDLLKRRMLSPWLLIKSKKFFKFLLKVKKDNPTQYVIIESLIRPKYWSKRFREHPTALKFMEKIVTGLDL